MTILYQLARFPIMTLLQVRIISFSTPIILVEH